MPNLSSKIHLKAKIRFLVLGRTSGIVHGILRSVKEVNIGILKPHVPSVYQSEIMSSVALLTGSSDFLLSAFFLWKINSSGFKMNFSASLQALLSISGTGVCVCYLCVFVLNFFSPTVWTGLTASKT